MSPPTSQPQSQPIGQPRRTSAGEQPRADVCLIVEGSYPYITGGVSSWVHQIITNLSEVRFALVTLLPDEDAPRQDRYPVPPNVVVRQDVFLFGLVTDDGTRREGNAALMDTLFALHQTPIESRCPIFGRVEALLRAGKQTAVTLQTARSSWYLLKRLYEHNERHVSFLDYFWTWRAIHGPMFRLLDASLPKADVYHPVSTGYAGFLAALAKFRDGAGMALTEHGLYTREREIEIANATWIYQEPNEGTAFAPTEPFFKRWWRTQYRFLGQLTYDACDRIVTLHTRNRDLQISAGAAPEKLDVVPNGIRPEDFASLCAPHDWSDRPFRMGLIGRVVPIKDVKTFLRAVQAVALTIDVEAYVLGPTDEDPAYFDECQALARLLGIDERVIFLGKVDLKKWLDQIDVNVLTSVSESQPLVILEAAAAGIPTIATDVGACREMLEGKPGKDALLGPSGLITPVASPDATAEAVLELARNPLRHRDFVVAGLARVAQHYHQDAVFAYYRRLYASLTKEAKARQAANPRQQETPWLA